VEGGGGMSMLSSLYQSNYAPPGTRKNLDRCSMDPKSTTRFVGQWAPLLGGTIVEAVGWFDNDTGSCRVLVADSDNGRRLIVRFNKNNSKITIQPHGRTDIDEAAGWVRAGAL
jgi:hypothetical protein